MNMYYKSPEQPNKTKPLIAITLSVIFTFLISFLYGIIIAFSPLVYINFFITVGFGIVIGYVIRIFMKIFTVIDKSIALYTSVICGILGLYFSWVVYILYFLPDVPLMKAYFSDFYLVFKPLSVFKIIREINRTGLWSVFEITFKDWALTFVWLIEAIIIVSIPYLLVKKQPQAPFSEKLNQWYKKYILFEDFESITMKEEFCNILTLNCIETIESLKKGLAYHHSKVSIFYLENEDAQYISIENIHTNRDGKNETSTSIIHLLTINTPNAKYLIDKYNGKKAFVFDY